MTAVRPLVSIVVPVYRSQDCLAELVRQIDDALIEWPHEVVLVNDCSPDHSWNTIVGLTHAHTTVIGINLRKNSGQDNALMAGFRQVKGAYVVVIDDDLQHSPYDIPALLQECLDANADICYAYFTIKHQAWWKRMGSWLNGKLAEIVIDKPRAIYLSPFKVIVREVVDEITNYRGPYPYIDGLLFTITSNVTQHIVAHHPRYAGKSNYGLLRSIRVAAKLATSFSVAPLRIASWIGMITALLGIVFGVLFVIEALFYDKPVLGWPSLMVALLTIGGLTLLSLGLVGEYLGRAYLLLNSRPQYCVKEVCQHRDASGL